MFQSITQLLVVLCVALTFVTRAEAAAGDCLGDDPAPAVIASTAEADEDCHTAHHAAMPAGAPQDHNEAPQPHDEALCQCLAMVKVFAALPAPLQPVRSLSPDRAQRQTAAFVSTDLQPGLRPPIV